MNYTEEQIEQAYEMQDWDILMEHFEFGDWDDWNDEYEVTCNKTGKTVTILVNRLEWMALDTMSASQTPDFDMMYWEAAQVGAAELGVDEEEVTIKEL